MAGLADDPPEGMSNEGPLSAVKPTSRCLRNRINERP
jgi:hypothetical protein